jgi:hypothetical protein
MAEAAVILILLVVISVHNLLIAPGQTAADAQAFGERAGYYVAPLASGIATFLSVLWVARKLSSDFVAHGTLVGVAGVILTVGFLFAAKPEDRFMYTVSFAIRILAGYLGGVVAQRGLSPAPARSSARSSI